MTQDGWYSGDLDVRRPEKDLKLLMRADDVHVVPLVTWTTKESVGERPAAETTCQSIRRQFFYSVLGGELSSPGNRCGCFVWISRCDCRRFLRAERPTAWEACRRCPGVTSSRVIRRLGRCRSVFARDLPIWIAAGQIDSVQLARASSADGVGPTKPAAGRAIRELSQSVRQRSWSQKIYYHLLNCGLQIPPTAGSGAGDNGNPVGYNRVYVHLEPTVPSDSGGPAAPRRASPGTIGGAH